MLLRANYRAHLGSMCLSLFQATCLKLEALDSTVRAKSSSCQTGIRAVSTNCILLRPQADAGEWKQLHLLIVTTGIIRASLSGSNGCQLCDLPRRREWHTTKINNQNEYIQEVETSLFKMPNRELSWPPLIWFKFSVKLVRNIKR